MKTKRIPSKLLRALKVLACMRSGPLSYETMFTVAACEEAIKTAQEYACAERMEVDDEP